MVELSGFVCDFDSGVVGRRYLEEVFTGTGVLAPYQFVAWTSYSHGLERKERWRVFIPYSEPLPVARHRDAYEYFNAIFGGELDPSCAKPAQLWYLPGCPRDALPIAGLFAKTAEARPFDISSIAPAVVHVVQPAADPDIAGELPALPGAEGRASNDDLVGGVGYELPSLREIVEMLAVLPKREYGDYDPWLKIGMAVHHGTQGSELGERIWDRWSSTVPGYDPALIGPKWKSFGGRTGGVTVGTLVALARAQGWAPSIAPPADSNNVGAAAGATSNNATQPTPVATQPPIPAVPLISVIMPSRFRNGTSPGGLPQILKTVQADDGSEREMLVPAIVGYHLVRVESLANKDDGVNTGEFEFVKPSGKIVVRIPTATMSSLADMAAALNEKGVHIYRGEEKLAAQELMMDWLKKVQAEKRERNTVSRWGWVEPKGLIEGFAAGSTVYLPNGRRDEDAVVSTYPDLFQHYKPQGCLAEWQKCANFIAQQGTMPLVTILATAFAAPLVRLAGLDGVLLSIVSTKSGVGKTTAMQTAQAVWGGRKAMHGTDDTVNAFGVKMGVIQNLPCYWDDIKGETALSKLPDLVYQITNGREKSRSNTGGGLNVSRQWSTMAAFASNESIIDRMRQVDTGSGTDASLARIFEIRLEHRPTDDRQNATFFAATRTNYGHAGAAYAAYLAEHHEEASGMLGALMRRLEEQLRVESDERFWVMAIATLIVGAAIARKLGLVLFDVPALQHYLVGQLHTQRGAKKQVVNAMTAPEIIRDMMNDLNPDTLVLEHAPPRGVGKEPSILQYPVRKEIIKACRLERDRIYRVRTSSFVEWMEEHRQSGPGVLRQLVELKAVNASVVMALGAGTHLKAPRSRVHEIDLAKLDL